MPTHAAPPDSRRRRRRRRALPIALLAFVALVAGLVVGASHVPGDQRTVEAFAAAWQRGDYAAMRSHIALDRQAAVDLATFTAAYESARITATVRSMQIGRPRRAADGAYTLPVTMHTASFGDVSGSVRLPIAGSGDAARIDWTTNLTFPGVPAGTSLERRTSLPPRASLLARDNAVLAEGETRTSPSLAAIAPSIVGQLGPIPPERVAEFQAAGYPDDAQVGISGLERIFERRLAGTPGGELLAGGRVLANRPPRPARAVRTTISPALEQTAITALAGRLGGVVALQPRTGEVLAVAGIGFSGLQPPGSTMKMVTLAGALRAGIAKPSSTYPLASSATLSGVTLGNANHEVCGGTLTQAFAISCNSVFAPLGAKLGAKRLVEIARRFGFNRPPPFAGAATSTIPPPAEIGDDLAVGSSAIGQGRVQATTLQMTMVAATFGLGGRLPVPRLDYRDGAHPKLGRRVVSTRVAQQVRDMMVEVVRRGTGVRAAIPGVTVAGKTGTAELRTTQPCTPVPDNPESCPPGQQIDPTDTTDTDAWFAAFAPARSPRIAVGVLLVASGAGGDNAAPAARLVMVDALSRY